MKCTRPGSSRRTRFALTCALLLLGGALARADDDDAKTPVTLIGSVWDDESNAITNATVFIYTARPRKGVGSVCPSCYPDCEKKAKTDSEGKFKIEQVDAALLFKVLVMAKGYESAFVDKVDVSKGLMEVGLRNPDQIEGAPTNQIQGRIVDLSGKPVLGATVKPDNRYGRIRGGERTSITDEKGQFTIRTAETSDPISFIIEARGLAKTRKNGLGADKGHFIKLKQGASITGRVLRDGKPVNGISIAASDNIPMRWTPESLGEFEIGTDPEGRFKLGNLPAETDYVIFGKIKALKDLGAIGGHQVRSGVDGSSVDVGDLNVQPGRRLAGFVVVAGDEPVPPGIKMFVNREDTSDSLTVDLDDDGAFDVRGIPDEPISIHVRMPGYRLSAKNPNLDRLNPFRIMGRVDRDIMDLQILFEPGKDYQHRDEALSDLPGPEQPRDVPLRGVPVKTE